MMKLSTTMALPEQSLSFGNKTTCLAGPVFRAMSSAHARFKYALRQCRLDEQMISRDKLAYHMQCHDENRFWKEINIRNRSK